MVRNILRVVHRHSGDKCLVVHRHSGDECFPQWFSLGGVLEGYSDCTPVASEARKVFNGEELDTSLGGHQVYPWCICIPPQW